MHERLEMHEELSST